jgi:hypothetical protein
MGEFDDLFEEEEDFSDLYEETVVPKPGFGELASEILNTMTFQIPRSLGNIMSATKKPAPPPVQQPQRSLGQAALELAPTLLNPALSGYGLALLGKDFLFKPSESELQEQEKVRRLEEARRTRQPEGVREDILKGEPGVEETLTHPAVVGSALALGGLTEPIAAASPFVRGAGLLGREFLSEATLGGFDLARGSLKKLSKISSGPKIGEEAGSTLKDFVGGPKKKFDKYAGSVNLNRQRISDRAKQHQFDVFEEQGRKVKISNAELEKGAAEEVKKFADDPAYLQRRLDAIKEGETPTVKEELAHRMINANNQESLIKAADDVAKGNMTMEEFHALQSKVDKNFLETTNPLAAAAGRRLNMYNIQVGQHRALQAINKLGKQLNPRQLEDLRQVDANNPLSVQDFVDRLPDPRLKDYFYEYWYNSILSGVPTHLVNTGTNTLWAAFQLPHRALTAGVDKAMSTLKGRPREYFLNEIVPMMAGMRKGFRRGATGAKETFKTGKTLQFESKFNQDIGGNVISAFERSPNKFVRKVGKHLTYPTRALRAMDVWANSISYDAQIAALARRQGMQRGLRGKALKDFEQNLIGNPSKEMMDAASQHAKYATFMEEPGKITQKILELRETIPGARLVVPFVNTIGNLTKRGLEMTPGVGLALARGQKPAEVVAKQIEGSILAMAMFNKVADGELTGPLPENKAEREAWYREGKKPWAIKIGNNWFEYRRIEPFNSVLAGLTIAYDKIQNAKDEEGATEIFMGIAKGLAENVLDSGYLSGLQDLLNRHGKWESTAERQVATLTPYSSFWRSINRAYEAATEGKAKLRESSDLSGAFAQTLPFLRHLKKPRLNVWGEEINLEGNFLRQWLPWKWSKEKPDQVEKMLKSFDVYPSIPSQNVTIDRKKVELPEKLYREYQVKFGKEAYEAMKYYAERQDGGLNLYNIPKENAQRILKNAIDRVRDRVLFQVKSQYRKRNKK